jgi:uncharacterized repeat protein (TIGR01451 family)
MTRRASGFKAGFVGKKTVSIDTARTIIVAAVLALGGGLLVAPVALAVTPAPAWTVSSQSEPTNFAPGDSSGHDQYVVTVTNIGGAPSNGAPITVADTLPAGLTLAAAGASWRDDFFNSGSCTAGPPITCEDPSAQLLPGMTMVIDIPVDVAANAVSGVANSVTVTGGGVATPAATSQATTISATPAAFGVRSFENLVTNADGSPDAQAGSHPYQVMTNLNVTTTLNPKGEPIPTGNLKDVHVALPPGLVGDPSATPQCTAAEMNKGPVSTACPADSQVGIATITGPASNGPPIPQAFPIYNMVPPPGMPAQFAFKVIVLPVFVDTAVRTGGDYGITASVVSTAQLVALVQTSIALWGDPADPSHETRRCAFPTSGCSPTPYQGQAASLLTVGTSCSGPETTSLSMNDWLEPGSFAQAGFVNDPAGLGGCNQLDFKPTISVQPESSIADSPTGLSVDLQMPQAGLTSTTGLAEADLKKTVVALPAGITLSPSAADGLGACSPTQIGLSNSEEPSCPDSSKIGSVEVTSPLLPDRLKGVVYLAEQGNNPFGSLLAIYVAVKGDGVLVKLAGHVVADPNTGQLTTTFDNNPQLPFSDFKLDFYGGARATLATPASCGAFTPTASFSSWAQPEAPVNPLVESFTINAGCTPGFTPTFTAGTMSNQAGSFSPFVLSLSRSDSEQQMKGLTFTMPPGVSAVLKGVPRCPDTNAAAGTCPEASRLGSVTVGSGVGSDPFFLKGTVYLTGPYNGGPFGEVTVVPANAGPFHLGNVVVRGSIRVDPKTAQPTVVSDPFPQFVGNTGIPTDVKRVDVTLDRPGFTFNPTNCNELHVTGTLTSTQGASSNVSSRFAAAECRSLAFKPAFVATTVAKTSRKNGAALKVKVTPGAGQANIARVDVQVPRGLAVRDSTLNQACTERQFAADPAACPAGSFVGTATARTPILAAALSGPAIFVSHGGAKFPDLDIVLQGEGVTVILTGGTDVRGNLLFSHFDTVPDAPVSAFSLSLPEGPHSALAAVGNLCTQVVHKRTVRRTLAMPTTITGQNGAVVHQSTKVSVSGCGRLAKAPKRK